VQWKSHFQKDIMTKKRLTIVLLVPGLCLTALLLARLHHPGASVWQVEDKIRGGWPADDRVIWGTN
jgi:hypothetical protein